MTKADIHAEETPHVVVAIVSTDEVENIVGCLQALDKSEHKNLRVVICENSGVAAFERDIVGIAGIDQATIASENTDATSAGTESKHFFLGDDKLPVVLLRARENLGYSGGVNACIAAAGEDWDFIWVLNPDTFPEADALAALIRRQRQGGYGIVGSRIVFVSNGRVQLMGGLRWLPLIGRHRSLGLNQTLEAIPDVESIERNLDVVSGVSMLVSKNYITNVGVMDVDFFVYYEDTEWSLRRGDFRLGYAHDSIVHHVAGATSGSAGPKKKRSKFSIYLTERNRIILARKRYPLFWPGLAVIAFLHSLEYLLRFASLRSFRIALSGWWAGLSGETGMPGFMRTANGTDSKVFLKRQA